MDHILEKIVSTSESVLAVMGVLGAVWFAMKRLYKMARNIETVLAEVRPNGGGSLRDAINRIEGDLRLLHSKQDAQSKELAELKAKVH